MWFQSVRCRNNRPPSFIIPSLVQQKVYSIQQLIYDRSKRKPKLNNRFIDNGGQHVQINWKFYHKLMYLVQRRIIATKKYAKQIHGSVYVCLSNELSICECTLDLPNRMNCRMLLSTNTWLTKLKVEKPTLCKFAFHAQLSWMGQKRTRERWKKAEHIKMG